MATAPNTAPGQSRLERLKSSPRAQRRLFILSLGVFALGAVALTSALFWNTSSSKETPISNEPAQVLKQQAPVPLSDEAKQVAIDWILAAVTREDLPGSYALTHEDIRGSMTRAEWETGNIPVVPYPVNVELLGERWQVDYSFADEALIEVGLMPAKGAASNIEPLTFFIGLKKVGDGASARWVVNYWSPRYKPPVPLAQ